MKMIIIFVIMIWRVIMMWLDSDNDTATTTTITKSVERRNKKCLKYEMQDFKAIASSVQWFLGGRLSNHVFAHCSHCKKQDQRKPRLSIRHHSNARAVLATKMATKKFFFAWSPYSTSAVWLYATSLVFIICAYLAKEAKGSWCLCKGRLYECPAWAHHLVGAPICWFC